MNYKSKTVISVCLMMALVFSGCDFFGIRKAEAEVNETLKLFNKALYYLDADDVRRLTDWTEDDPDYYGIEKLLDSGCFRDIDEDTVTCTKYVASTISIDYDIDTLNIDGSRASIDVTYELTDWEKVYSDSTLTSYDEILTSLKSSKDKKTINSTITFELVEGRWKMCQIYNLGEVLKFVYSIPLFETLE